MGIIINQSIKGTIYSYIGAFIGFINTALLFPIFLTTSEIGLLFLLISLSMIFAQIFGLGINGVTTRLFPYFKNNENQHNGFSFILYGTSFIGIIIFLISFNFILPIIIEQNKNSLEFIKNINLLIPIVIIEIAFRALNNYASALLNSVIGTLYKELILRLAITILIIFFSFKIIDFNLFLYLYIAVQTIPVIAILIYLIQQNELFFKPNLKFLTSDLKKSILFTSIVSLVTGLSATGYQFIDNYMVNSFLDLSKTGVYTISFFFGSLIGLSSRSLNKISTIIIAKAWKDKNYNEIKTIYTKSSITQTIVSAFIFLGITININDIIIVLGPEYIEAKLPIFFIALSFFIDSIFGVSSSIISQGKDFKYLSFFMILFLLIIILTNYILIPIFGITGAALASTISTLFFVSIKYLFIYFKYKMQPFSKKHIISILLTTILFIIFYYFPYDLKNSYINVTVKSLIFSIIYTILVYKFKISDDANTFLKQLITKITKQ